MGEENPLEKFIDFHFNILNWYEYLVYVGASVFCVCFAGLMSGLTLGLLSFETMSLEILIQTGTKREKGQAKKILRLVKRHHWLLVTLLISNAIAMEALPIFLDELVPSTVAILISVTCILLFGEVIPQALCSRYGLLIGSMSFYIVAFLMIITFPISFPIAKLLDCFLGKNHVTYYRRAQLKELVSLHAQEGARAHGPLNRDEITVIRGALEMSGKTIYSIMTSLENVFALPLDTILDMEVMQEIQKKGHSRIPVYEGEKRNIIGMLLVKNLISLSPKDEVKLKTMKFRKIPVVEEDMNIWDMLNYFQEGKSHMCCVVSSYRENSMTVPSTEAKYFDDMEAFKLFDLHYEPTEDEKQRMLESTKKRVRSVNTRKLIGVVTLEDVIEELIQEEIIDETDVFVDLNTHLKVADLYRRISLSTAARRSSLYMARRSKSSAPSRGGTPKPFVNKNKITQQDIERILNERERQIGRMNSEDFIAGEEDEEDDDDLREREIELEEIEPKKKGIINKIFKPEKSDSMKKSLLKNEDN